MSTMQNQHPGLTPEQNTWLMQNVGRAEEELLWRDVFARLHRLETTSKRTPEADRPEWWHRLNAASPEIAERAERAVGGQEDGNWSPFLVTAFYWRHTSEGREWWYEVDRFLNGTRPDLPPLPVENEQGELERCKFELASLRSTRKAIDDELTRLRAEVERLTKERDEAREQGRQEGHKEAREGIAEELKRCEGAAHCISEPLGALAYNIAANIARNWQPAQEGGAK